MLCFGNTGSDARDSTFSRRLWPQVGQVYYRKILE